MKKAFLLLACIFLFCAAIPLNTVCVAATASGTSGDCTWVLDGTRLTISGNGEMAHYDSASPAPWGTAITAVTIEGGVTSIGNSAFYNCKSLTAVTIPNSVTTVGTSAFRGCTHLAHVTLSNTLPALSDGMFEKCISLNRITLPPSIKCIGKSAFSGCSGLQAIELPAALETVDEDAFAHCYSLKNVYYRGNRTDRERIVIVGDQLHLTNESLWQYEYGIATTTTATPYTTGKTTVTATTTTAGSTTATPSKTASATSLTTKKHSTSTTFVTADTPPAETIVTTPTTTSPGDPYSGLWLGVAIGVGGCLLVAGIAVLVLYYLRDKTYR